MFQQQQLPLSSFPPFQQLQLQSRRGRPPAVLKSASWPQVTDINGRLPENNESLCFERMIIFRKEVTLRFLSISIFSSSWTWSTVAILLGITWSKELVEVVKFYLGMSGRQSICGVDKETRMVLRKYSQLAFGFLSSSESTLNFWSQKMYTRIDKMHLLYSMDFSRQLKP